MRQGTLWEHGLMSASGPVWAFQCPPLLLTGEAASCQNFLLTHCTKVSLHTFTRMQVVSHIFIILWGRTFIYFICFFILQFDKQVGDLIYWFFSTTTRLCAACKVITTGMSKDNKSSLPYNSPLDDPFSEKPCCSWRPPWSGLCPSSLPCRKFLMGFCLRKKKCTVIPPVQPVIKNDTYTAWKHTDFAPTAFKKANILHKPTVEWKEALKCIHK